MFIRITTVVSKVFNVKINMPFSVTYLWQYKFVKCHACNSIQNSVVGSVSPVSTLL